jgi:hypothetical protein
VKKSVFLLYSGSSYFVLVGAVSRHGETINEYQVLVESREWKRPQLMLVQMGALSYIEMNVREIGNEDLK